MFEFLEEENKILRGKMPARITVTAEERTLLVKLGSALGDAIKGLISIVTPCTFLRWLKGDKNADKPKPTKQPP